MSQTQPGAQPVLTSVAAHLYVRDIHASLDFYTGKLGFTLDFAYGEPSFYAEVMRDKARLALRSMDEPVFVGGIREREDLLSASITLGTADGIRQLFLVFRDAGVPFHQSLRNEIWQAQTFIVKDPDDNLLLFAGPAD